MKKNLLFSLICMIIFIIHSGCSIPKMVLKHENNIDSSYESRGSIKIHLFEDRRPDEERIEDKTAMNTLSPQIWSGSTSPEMMFFFQKSMMEEAERTQLFEVSEHAELELSGYVTSMKVSRRVTLWRYIGPAAFLIGLFTSEMPNIKTGEEGDFTPFLIGSTVLLISTFLDNPILSATVEFRAQVKLNGEKVFEKDIKLIEEDNYSAWTEWGWEGVSKKAAVVLDRAVTKSIKKLFEELIAEKERVQPQEPGTEDKSPIRVEFSSIVEQGGEYITVLYQGKKIRLLRKEYRYRGTTEDGKPFIIVPKEIYESKFQIE